jgi:hypothetical protein
VGRRLVEGCADHVGLGPGRLDVVSRRPRIDQLTGVQEVEVVVDLLLGGRAREDGREASLLQILDQLACPLERRDLVGQLLEDLVARVADRLAFLGFDPLADEGGDQLVPAHAHRRSRAWGKPPRRQKRPRHPQATPWR